MVFLPRPESINDPLVKELVEIANYAITVEVYPPNAFVHVGANDGIKPIFGSLRDTVRHKHEIVRRPLRHEPFPFKESLKPRKYGSLQAHGRLGAIVLRLKQMASPGRWKKACQVPVRTTFDLPEQGIKFPPLEFIKVCELWWGHDFKNHDFYNLSGFQFRLQDNKQNLCHMQFWTAGHNVKAEYHDHHDNAFKELHTCLSQGTPSKPGKRIGGMWAPKPSTCDSIIPESSSSSCSSIPMESLGLEDDAFPPAPPGVKHCGLEPLEEHGRIWHEDATGNAVYRRNNTVSYPRHQWAAGDGGEDKCIDVWMALEFDAWLDFDM
ncbi:hypothetical protein BJY04DRAFT_231152 [Aspergillus karnatakaensis]|uniref:uncharacterized protein n=1 Tax=Aspergillus karnatakaensis TaxID=1810916 RepID=UPI003CCE14E0